ncbi:uncharacterized protein LOC116611634 [Nematostella vectensis]|uniref:uncharacterized protein LOC116611634 n=1 Tax=Nematostella vectensis TaxID=45351 RepID=UPI00207738E4|nr:uncharacterized protein LOC116611634 [Nematostella vectensis]
MDSRSILFALVTVFCFHAIEATQTCRPMKDTIFEGCMSSGYNTTFPIPPNIDLSGRAKSFVKYYINYFMRRMENCSVAAMGESVLCSMFAPYCRPQDSEPFLPCRRVCSEFLKRCVGDIDLSYLEYYVSSCTLLPNATADSGKCFEPQGFHYHYNASTKGLLENECSPLIFPMCKSIGYSHTSISLSTQLKVYNIFYQKKFSNTSEDAVVKPGSTVDNWQGFFKNFSQCSLNLKKFFCGDLFPPCFPDEGLQHYTLCQSFCYDISVKCPALLNTVYGPWLSGCELLASGNTSHGYCRTSSWPPPMAWLKWFQDYQTPSPPPSQNKPAVQGLVVAVAVIVPIILIVLIILGVLAWRHHRLPKICLRGEDKEDLVKLTK